MRILLISDVYFPRVNGVSTSIQTLRRELLAMGHQVTLVAPDYGGEVDEADIVRVPGHTLAFDPEDRLMRWGPLNLALDALPGGFDVVHIHTPFAAHFAGVRYARRHGLPVLESYHTLFEEYFHHYLPLLPRAFTRWAARRISRWQCGQVDKVIAPSGPLRQALLDYGIQRPIRVVPTGLPPESFIPGDGHAFRRRLGLAPGRPVLLYVGRLAFEKNIGFLLDMLAVLRREVPEACLVLAGEGPAETELRRQTERLGLTECVHFVGYLDRHGELPDCYRAADLFVFASRTETQGLVLLEAMAQGTPVLALAEMGSREVLRDGLGCRVARADVEAFARLAADLLRAPELLAELARRAPDYARGWRSDVLSARVAALYQDMRHSGHHTAEAEAEVPT